MKFDSLIFDLDGTLWDSSENVAGSWNICANESGLLKHTKLCITGEMMRKCMGMPMNDLAAALFPINDESIRMELLEKCMEYENDYIAEHGGILFEDEEQTLKRLSEKYRLFIVSNCQKGYIEAFLKYTGFWKYFTGHLCWGDTRLSKGITIQMLMKQFACTSAVYAGDTQGDHIESANAGIPFIHAAYGFGTSDSSLAVYGTADRFSDYTGILNK